jgi:hypothetical protein
MAGLTVLFEPWGSTRLGQTTTDVWCLLWSGTPPISGFGENREKKSFPFLLYYIDYSIVRGSPTPTTTAMTMAGEKENVDNVHKHQHKVFMFFSFCTENGGKFSHTEKAHSESCVLGEEKVFRLFFLVHNNTCFV